MRGYFVSGTCSSGENSTYHACFLHASRRIVAVTYLPASVAQWNGRVRTKHTNWNVCALYASMSFKITCPML